MSKLNLSILVTALLTLEGCSTYSESFTCPIGDGLSCTSLYDVHKKIDNKEIGVIDEVVPTAPASQLDIYFLPYVDAQGQSHGAEILPLPKGGRY